MFVFEVMYWWLFEVLLMHMLCINILTLIIKSRRFISHAVTGGVKFVENGFLAGVRAREVLNAVTLRRLKRAKDFVPKRFV